MSADSISSYNACPRCPARRHLREASPEHRCGAAAGNLKTLARHSCVVSRRERGGGLHRTQDGRDADVLERQHFDEPELEASGSFHMAQIAYDDAAQIDEQKLAGWLAKAGTSIWDMVGSATRWWRAARKAKAKVKSRPSEGEEPKSKVEVKRSRERRKTKKRAKAK
jgi:hypothetical protein